jgi:tetratricopeptide (TPR) repeat protein
MRYAAKVLLILLPLPPGVSAQTDTPGAAIVQAYALEEHGHLAEAVALARPLVESGTLQGAELGRAWSVLGLVYTGQRAFSAAQHAYEQAISLLQPVPERAQDYASAMDNFGSLYRAMGQFEAATNLRLKTLHVYEQIGDHSGIARVCNNLASLALEQRDMKKAGKYLKRSAEEMKIATALDDDDVGAIYSMQAEFAGLNGNIQAEIDGYEHAMQVWKRVHSEDHPNTGWGYMLLGRAHADAGRTDEAVKEMQQGLSILDRTLGRASPHYLEAELAYSRLLDETGAHDAAARLRAADEATLKALSQKQCVGCTISIDALR